MIDDPQLTRRRLLAFGGAAVATAAVPGTARAASRAARPSWADRDALAARVGDSFVMRSDDGSSVAVRLQSVRDLPGTTPRGRSLKRHAQAYALTFKPVSAAPSGQATRTFSHPQLGSTQLFAVAGDATYTVVVNRSVRLGTANRWSAAAVRMNNKRRRRARRR